MRPERNVRPMSTLDPAISANSSMAVNASIVNRERNDRPGLRLASEAGKCCDAHNGRRDFLAEQRERGVVVLDPQIVGRQARHERAAVEQRREDPSQSRADGCRWCGEASPAAAHPAPAWRFRSAGAAG